MGSTARHAYRYPDGSNPVTLATYFRQLADDVDAQVPWVSSSTPPHKNGLVWYNPTTKNTQISDGTAWQPINIQPISYTGNNSEVSVAAANVAQTPLATPDSSYWSVAGAVATVQRTGVWALSLAISAGVAGDFPLIGAIQVPAMGSWDGRTYTGRCIDWNSTSRASASWTGVLTVGQQFSFYRANHDTVARMMGTAYTITFVGVA